MDQPQRRFERGIPRSLDRRRFTLRALVIDLSALLFALVVLGFVSPTASPTGYVPSTPPEWNAVFTAAVILSFFLGKLYTAPFRLDVLTTVRQIAAQSALAATAVMTLRVLVADDQYVAAETVRHWLLILPPLAVGRAGVVWAEARMRRRGVTATPTLILGAGRIGRLTARRLLNEPELGLRPVGFLDDDPMADDGPPQLPVLGGLRDFEGIAAEHDVRHVIVGFSRASHDDLLVVARRCWQLGISVSVVPRLFELEGERVAMEHLGSLPVVQLQPADPDGWQFNVKYAIDRIIAGLMLLAVLPLLAAAALAVRISLGKPIFFRQWRIGRDGRGFEMLKFRSMRDAPTKVGGEADAAWADAQINGLLTTAGSQPEPDIDARATRVGAWLRRFSIDELPQLWNVFRGDMSLVGPRPERMNYVERFNDDIYRYSDRHRVKSGLTGWAQVNGLRGATSLRDRIEFDNHYIENWSIWLDFKIMLLTIPAMLKGSGR